MTEREDHEERALLNAIFHPTESSPTEQQIFVELRRRAKEVAFSVKRDRKGCYRLLQGGAVVAGDREPLDLKHLVRELQRRCIIGYEGSADVRLPIASTTGERKWRR